MRSDVGDMQSKTHFSRDERKQLEKDNKGLFLWLFFPTDAFQSFRKEDRICRWGKSNILLMLPLQANALKMVSRTNNYRGTGNACMSLSLPQRETMPLTCTSNETKRLSSSLVSCLWHAASVSATEHHRSTRFLSQWRICILLNQINLLNLPGFGAWFNKLPPCDRSSGKLSEVQIGKQFTTRKKKLRAIKERLRRTFKRLSKICDSL